MNPDTVKPADHKAGIWWRRWSGSIAFLLVVIGGTYGLVQVESTANNADDAADSAVVTAHVAKVTAKRVRHEGKVRERQFCKLVLDGLHERRKRLLNTEEFLETPAGKEPTALNIYIREISLPQTQVEVAKEQEGIPSICWQYNTKSKSH